MVEDLEGMFLTVEAEKAQLSQQPGDHHSIEAVAENMQGQRTSIQDNICLSCISLGEAPEGIDAFVRCGIWGS